MKLLTTNSKLEKHYPGWRCIGLQLAPAWEGGYANVCPMASTPRSRSNLEDCIRVLEAGGKISFIGNSLPEALSGFSVADGDKHDLFFLREEQIMLLKPKNGIKPGEGCIDKCIFTSGHGRLNATFHARVNRKTLFILDRRRQLAVLHRELVSFREKCEREGKRPAVRLNVFSDIPWESRAWGRVPQHHPGITFYDYTKRVNRMWKHIGGDFPPNYHLLLSENNRHTP